MTFNLMFDVHPEKLAPGAIVLRGFAVRDEAAILSALNDVTVKAPFRQMITPGGSRMSVEMTNCGRFGWVTDESGYRYINIDPASGDPWPQMPTCMLELAKNSAARASFNKFIPNACLINRYKPGARLYLHQDKDEQDFSQPIVSVSLGLPAVFLFGGLRRRQDKPLNGQLNHGDVLVMGGPARLRYHGVMPLKQGAPTKIGRYRINLTFRKAG